MIRSKASRILMAGVILSTCLFLAGMARAHDTYNIRMNIPFDFYVGDKLLPAGEYDVLAWENAVRIHNTATGISTGISMQALKKDSGVIAIPEVIFNKYGDEHFLTEIWWGRGTSVGSMPMSTKHEIELAKAFNPVRVATRASR